MPYMTPQHGGGRRQEGGARTPGGAAALGTGDRETMRATPS